VRIAPGIIGVRQLFSPAEAETLVGEAESHARWIDATVGSYRGTTLTAEFVDRNLSTAQVTRGFRSSSIDVGARIRYAADLVRELWAFEVEFSPIYSLSRYNAGTHLSRHHDAGPDHTSRVLTLVLYLNENYSGGRFVFSDLGIRVRPDIGDALLFPSETFHEVETVEEGTRYVLITFAAPKVSD
jgi:hypothetical protein